MRIMKILLTTLLILGLSGTFALEDQSNQADQVNQADQADQADQVSVNHGGDGDNPEEAGIEEDFGIEEEAAIEEAGIGEVEESTAGCVTRNESYDDDIAVVENKPLKIQSSGCLTELIVLGSQEPDQANQYHVEIIFSGTEDQAENFEARIDDSDGLLIDVSCNNANETEEMGPEGSSQSRIVPTLVVGLIAFFSLFTLNVGSKKHLMLCTLVTLFVVISTNAYATKIQLEVEETCDGSVTIALWLPPDTVFSEIDTSSDILITCIRDEDENGVLSNPISSICEGPVPAPSVPGPAPAPAAEEEEPGDEQRDIIEQIGEDVADQIGETQIDMNESQTWKYALYGLGGVGFAGVVIAVVKYRRRDYRIIRSRDA